MSDYRKNVLCNEIKVLRKGERADFTYKKIDGKKCDYRLFFTCEDVFCPLAKNESGAEHIYMLIDDSLNYEKAEMNRYCLDLSCKKPYPFPKRVMKKIIWQNLDYGLYSYKDFCEYNEAWKFGIYCKAENLEISEGGYLHLRFDIWKVRENVDVNDTTACPDETYFIDIPEGSYSYKKLEKAVNIKEKETACVMITLEGEGYFGNVYFESPYLCDFEERNLISEFERGTFGLKRFAWFGQNLSKREWPEFEILINGETVFSDEVFLKVHNYSPVEIALPKDCMEKGENKISIVYKSDYLDTIPVKFGEVFLLEKEIEEFSLVNCPDGVIKGEDVRLLIETEGDGEVLFESGDFSFVKRKVFKGFNLQVLTLKCEKGKNNISFKLSLGNKEKTYTISRCITKEKDNVIAGSGDMIYIDVSNLDNVKDYVKWYLKNDIGKMITIRPVYRWGGQRYVNPDVWQFFRELCEETGLYYVNISDGRDIPGITANPSFEMLDGKNFLGRQLHERDGQFFYWSYRPREVKAEMNEFFDLALRLGREMPDYIDSALRLNNIKWYDNIYSMKRDFAKTTDLKEMHEIVTSSIREMSKDNFTRETGPTVMFKYFYQNGFKWTGAETMDGATEMLLAFLRGASDAYGAEKFGVHLALQWSTYPHDTEQRMRRYLLSMYIPYMHGVTDINTEEGLWFIEARYGYYNRLSEVCEKHRRQIRKFNKFVRSHSRTGKFHTPVALLQGRMDGWNGFSTEDLWGMPGVVPGDESKGWEILSLFYPLNSFENCDMAKTGCILPDNDKPFGLFSGTPNGNVDAVPIEKGDFENYSVLVMSGYNMADKNDLDRLYTFVEKGGTLVSTWAHFSDTTEYKDIREYKLNIIDHKITNLFAEGIPEFATDFADGKEVLVCKNLKNDCKASEKTDSGVPYVCTFNVGEGKIVLLNTLYYPGNENVITTYKKIALKVSREAYGNEPLNVKCGVDVQYTVFRQEDGANHYYFTPVDWYNNSEEDRCAEILLDGYKYNLSLKFGEIMKLVQQGERALWPENDGAEIVSLEDNGFYIQGAGIETVYSAFKGEIKKYDVDLTTDSIKYVEY